MKDVAEFIRAYQHTDAARIAFAWNGKHADDFFDANNDFRQSVLEAVFATLDEAPLPLIRDLFRAETEFSGEAWCIDVRITDLAETMLTRGGAEYLMDFLTGQHQSFDAAMACRGIVISRSQLEALLVEVDRLLASDPTDEERQMLQVGRGLFTEIAGREQA